ncbi:MAG TPA: Wzz/FepE/Etk N-terminal domain-containing protein [Bacillota bacterium]|nr:Wzz/FepE/Etk N-terminal domain-containing protein [Bacillota bacterium]HPF42280.1 Wzz/FepE/Etk N-terminal domain-containing protein [Bacillota bacterium]HPJ86114.1 Wzz/FepE/Etk N-terminal domain-containing protein [Bacillota bacterium]HPQ61953.1 Wzz/FepE/Etk N-terminal domain-containing protein [Bacillota bacterium]
MEEFEKQETSTEEGMTFTELLRIVWDNFLLIVLITVWITALGFVYTFAVVSPKYTAETAAMVQVDTDSGTSEQSAISIANYLMTTYKEFIVSRLVLESVINDVDGISDMTVEQLANSVTVSSTSGAYIIYINVDNTSPELAQAIANQIVDNAIAIADDEANGFTFLQDKLKLVYSAALPEAPSSPNKPLNIIISFILGGVIALMVVFFKEIFNNKFQTKEELEKVLNLRVIATVPGTIKERKLVD